MGQLALDSHAKSTGHQTSMKNRSAGEHLEEHLPFVLQNCYYYCYCLIFGYRSFCLDHFRAHRLHFRIQSQAATAGHLNGKF